MEPGQIDFDRPQEGLRRRLANVVQLTRPVQDGTVPRAESAHAPIV
jgi:hypothetical protein